MPRKILPQWKPGQPVSATRLNEIQRQSQRADHRSDTGDISTESGTFNRKIHRSSSSVVERWERVRVKNNSGSDRTKDQILGIDGVDGTPTDAQHERDYLVLDGSDPDFDTHQGKWVLLLEDIADGKSGWGTVLGVKSTKITVNNTAHTHADVPEDSSGNQLSSAYEGAARILYKESGTGADKWALLRIGNFQSQSGHVVIQFRVSSLAPYTDEVSSPCEAVLAEVVSISCQSAGVDVGDEITVYDPNGCWFNVPVEVLEGAIGQAVNMEPDAYGQVPDCIELGDSGGCWWLVQHLCCTEELYAD